MAVLFLYFWSPACSVLHYQAFNDPHNYVAVVNFMRNMDLSIVFLLFYCFAVLVQVLEMKFGC